ncbi:hypothetical protein V1478_000633 [Vespula squamosa]|uniref:Uncharacterized protein n=1 Tax=Vespula squamosa TaxID=30214 RepID=A0ABD2C627_VESSQ
MGAKTTSTRMALLASHATCGSSARFSVEHPTGDGINKARPSNLLLRSGIRTRRPRRQYRKVGTASKAVPSAPLVLCPALYVGKFAIFPFNISTLTDPGWEAYDLNILAGYQAEKPTPFLRDNDVGVIVGVA